MKSCFSTENKRICTIHQRAFYLNCVITVLILAVLIYLTFFSEKYVIALSLAQAVPPTVQINTSGSDSFQNILEIHQLWSSQASLYQTIIALLIFLNSIFGLVSYLYISRRSEDKIYEAASHHLESDPFKALMRENIADKVEKAMTPIWDQEKDRYARIELIETQIEALEKKLDTLVQAVSQKDSNEQAGSDLNISK